MPRETGDVRRETTVKSLIDRLINKPGWQHPDPAIRAEAVLRLPAAERDVLLAIARDDTEPRVRRAAAKKLSDVETLTELAGSDADQTVREEAAARLVHLAAHATQEKTGAEALAGLSEARHLGVVARSAALPELRQAAVTALDDPRTLATVVRETDDGATRLLALDRISDGSTLLALALKSDQKAVALRAVDRLDEEESLRAVAEKARLGAAARRARSRLKREREASPAGSVVDTPSAEEEQREREAYERARAVQEREARERAEAMASRVTLCESVEGAQGEALPSVLERAREGWVALPPLGGAEALASRFERALADGERRHQAWLAGLERRDELAAIVAEAEKLAAENDQSSLRPAWSELERRWKDLAASADQPDLRVRFETALGTHRAHRQAARDEREKRDRENLGRLTALAERAEALLTDEEPALRNVDRVSREIRAATEHPGHFPTRHDREEVLARLEAARKALYPRLQELREDAEWKQWANVSAQEDLCRRAEALLQEQDLARAARRLRDLDARWKQAREAPKEQAEELWTRFKAARDVVKERVDAHFAQQAEELAENLRRKEALCEQAEALADSTSWVKTADELRRLQAEWKEIGPVPRAQSRKVWDRFRKPCDDFFTRWQQHRHQRSQEWARNLALKEALCEKAESLQDSTDWEATAARLKQLQAEWRQIGAVKKSRSEAIWRRFRGACDHFFDRYKHRDALALEEVQHTRERLCGELEGLLPVEGTEATAPDDLVARLQAAQTAWRQAGELPRDVMGPLDERFRQIRDRLVERFPESFAGTELDPEASRGKAERLMSRVEDILQDLAPTGGAAAIESTEELAARLRDALAARTIGGREAEEARWHSATSEVEAAQAAWRRLGPMPGPEGVALAERFEAACRRFFEQRPRPERSKKGAGRRPRRRP
jgi:hypothetical protein